MVISFSVFVCFLSVSLGVFSVLVRVGLSLGKEKIFFLFSIKIYFVFYILVGFLILGLGICILGILVLLVMGLKFDDINDVCGIFGILVLLLVYGFVFIFLLWDYYCCGIFFCFILIFGSVIILLLVIVIIVFLSGLN